MTTIETTTTTIEMPRDDSVIDDAQLAAVGFLARYSGRTWMRTGTISSGFFQWAADDDLAVLAATRAHIEMYRSWMQDRGLAASTIDRRPSTACGYFRFAHIDGRIASNPRGRPPAPARTRTTEAKDWTAPSSAGSCSPPSSTTATMPGSPCFSG